MDGRLKKQLMKKCILKKKLSYGKKKQHLWLLNLYRKKWFYRLNCAAKTNPLQKNED